MSKKIPDIRFKGYTDAWEQCRFKDILKSHSFKQYLAEPKDDGEFEIIQQGDKPIIGYSDGEPFEEFSDVVLFGDHTVSLYKPSKPFFVATDGVKILSASGFNGQYLYATLERYKPESQGYKRHFTILKNEEMWLIKSKDEQIQIGNFFRSIDNLITLHQRKLDKTKELKKGLLQKMFPKNGESTPELRFSGYTDAWELRRVNEIFKVTRGQVLAATETSEKQSTEMPYPVYSSQTKNDGLMGYYNNYLFDTAITWTTDGANAGTVNYRKGKFYSTNVNGVLLSSAGFANKAIAEILNQEAWKWVSHVGNPKLMNNVMGDIIISIPPSLEEHNRLSEFFTSLDNLITLHQRKLDSLKELKKGFLQKMFV